MTVLVPTSSGIPWASHFPAPVAVPVAPAAVCQVTLVMPEPPAAVPDTVSDAALVVLTAPAGEDIEIEIGSPPPAEGGGVAGVSVVATVCEAVCLAASKAVTVTVLDPVTRVTPLAVQALPLMLARPL